MAAGQFRSRQVGVRIVIGGGRHAARRTARRRGKTLLRAEVTRPGQVRGPRRARLRGGVEIRDLTGILPYEVFSRLSRCIAPLAGSLPPHVSRRRMEPVSGGEVFSRAAGCVLRGAPVSAVTRAQRGKTGSKRDWRAAHGAARVAETMWRAPFFHGVERRAGSECALRRG
jgi:hypothetical protein